MIFLKLINLRQNRLKILRPKIELDSSLIAQSYTVEGRETDSDREEENERDDEKAQVRDDKEENEGDGVKQEEEEETQQKQQETTFKIPASSYCCVPSS